MRPLCPSAARLSPARPSGGLWGCGAPASTSAIRTAASSGSFLITTKGYGHGVGLSQWGAKSLAEQGWTYEAILTHYFPGTQLCR